jgi:hypothetical protein
LLFGRDDVPFTDVSEAGRGSRTFTRFSQAAEEAGRSRIYGGIHFEFDNHTGLASGRAVAREIFERHLRPLAAPASQYASNRAGSQLAREERVPNETPRVVTSYFRPNADESRPSSSYGGATAGSYQPVTTYVFPGASTGYGVSAVTNAFSAPTIVQPRTVVVLPQ